MTTKKRPHYPLPTVKLLVERGLVLIASKPLADAAGLGIGQQGILEAILELSVPVDFSKSESGYQNPREWQDAYITGYNGHSIYLKFFVHNDQEDTNSPDRLVVTSFKLNTN